MTDYKIAEKIHFEINKQICYKTDLENYQINEFWTIPTLFGDCEDYALLKRKKLLESGWDITKQHLVLCLMKEQNNQGHCVLLVNTNKGDYILDNCHEWPKPINEINYDWKYILKDGDWYEINGIT